MNLICLPYLFLAVMSLISFSSMGLDKRKARKNLYRIPEKRLFLYALLGGGIGGTLGMFVFHHKTRHWYFRLFFPVFAILQLALFVWFTIQIL